MRRLSAVFVALCMVLIAGSIGTIVYLHFGLDGTGSAIIGLIALIGLAMFNAVTHRTQGGGADSGEVADLARGLGDLARQVAELGRRVGAIESRAQAAVEKTLAATQPLDAEIGEVGDILKQVAETVAAHDTQLKVLAPTSSVAPAPPAPPSPPPPTTPTPSVAAAPTINPAPPPITPVTPPPPATPLPPPISAAPAPPPVPTAISPAAAPPPLPPAAPPVPPPPPIAPLVAALPTSVEAPPPAPKPAPVLPPAPPVPAAAASAPPPAAPVAGKAAELAVPPPPAPVVPPAPAPVVPPQPAEIAATPPVAPPAPPPPPPVSTRIMSGRFKDMEPGAVIDMIREAVDSNRIDLFLQPIVTLPQRKVRYYEAVARLRAGDGDPLMAGDFLPHAEAGGLMPKIDNLMMFRCVQVVRRLLAKNREIGLFCNLSSSTLVDAETFPQFSEFMEANKAIAPALVFEFTQGALRAMGPIENESLAALRERGYRFSLDNVTDLRIEPRDIAERGFRFVKVQSGLLLNRSGVTLSDIHPQDFSGLLSRHGIELIAAKIESEASVVDLLDYDVKFGQGFLFSPPRPVRPEVMQGIGDRNDVVVRDTPEPPAAGGGDAPAVPHRMSSLAQLARGVVARN
jgi:cyclic-di-GMP phosphodiesterase, flagellum assembly factor TipF